MELNRNVSERASAIPVSLIDIYVDAPLDGQRIQLDGPLDGVVSKQAQPKAHIPSDSGTFGYY
jgi:hypothetical protein